MGGGWGLEDGAAQSWSRKAGPSFSHLDTPAGLLYVRSCARAAASEAEQSGGA